jgi:small subunit ribosomal protein S8
MSMTDTIADMLTRIRNAVRNQAPRVQVNNSKVCAGIARVLKDEGYISDFDVIDDGRQGFIRIDLKYGPRGESIINSLQRLSRPGRRRYSGVADLPRPLAGMGIAVVSTPQGVLSDRQCRESHVGGELLCEVI